MSTLYEQIQALDPALVASRDPAAIASALSAGRVKLVPTLGGIGLVLETLGAVDGAALLNGLQAMIPASPPLKWAWYLLERGELDFGSKQTRAMIRLLVPAPARTALLSSAEVPDPVTPAQVELAIKNDDGSYK